MPKGCEICKRPRWRGKAREKVYVLSGPTAELLGKNYRFAHMSCYCERRDALKRQAQRRGKSVMEMLNA